MIINIGRADDNDVVLDNTTVSRKHARLEVTEGRIIVTDLNSTSGTYVTKDGKLTRISYHEVADNDVLLFGNERCLVRDLIDRVKQKRSEAVYQRNPLTGEIYRK